VALQQKKLKAQEKRRELKREPEEEEEGVRLS
jgi:hypothetical protein